MTYQTEEDRKVGAPAARDFFDGPPPLHPRRGATEPIMKKLRTMQLRAFAQIKREAADAAQQEEDSDTETNDAALLDQDPEQFAVDDRAPMSPTGASDDQKVSPQLIATPHNHAMSTGELVATLGTGVLAVAQDNADVGTVKDEEMKPASNGAEEPQTETSAAELTVPLLPECTKPMPNPAAWKQSVGELPTQTQAKEEEMADGGGDADEQRFELPTEPIMEVIATALGSPFPGIADATALEEEPEGTLPDIEALQLGPQEKATEPSMGTHEV